MLQILPSIISVQQFKLKYLAVPAFNYLNLQAVLKAIT
jgi:hypothetical protein